MSLKIIYGRPSAIPITDIVGNPAPFVFGILASLSNGSIPTSSAGLSIPHGLTDIPNLVRVVLECLVNDVASGYVSGQEINIESVLDGTSSFTAFAVNVDEVNVNIYRSAGSSNFQLIPNGGGAIIQVTAETNFAIKAYVGYMTN